jgi:alkylation response protein AidB-like acyl-CoA dehydrogenase
MNFDLNEETRAVQEMARRFAEKEVLPRVKEDGFKRDLVSQMGELGLFGSAFPPRYGGTDFGFPAPIRDCARFSISRP